MIDRGGIEGGAVYALSAALCDAIERDGGVKWAEIDETFMLRKLPSVFVAGEMINWEAPTGGYLLQACFATGRAAGAGAADRLERGAREIA